MVVVEQGLYETFSRVGAAIGGRWEQVDHAAGYAGQVCYEWVVGARSACRVALRRAAVCGWWVWSWAVVRV